MENDRIRFVDYKGKRILLEDFTNIENDEALEPFIREAGKVVQQQPLKSLLVAVDLTNSHFGPKTSQTSKSVAKDNELHIKASALIGMNKMMEVVYNSLRFLTGRDIISFRTREEAFEWLVKQ